VTNPNWFPLLPFQSHTHSLSHSESPGLTDQAVPNPLFQSFSFPFFLLKKGIPWIMPNKVKGSDSFGLSLRQVKTGAREGDSNGGDMVADKEGT